jgi:phosphoglycerol transferase MdoB-like AlkP superfamily enzyme
MRSLLPAVLLLGTLAWPGVAAAVGGGMTVIGHGLPGEAVAGSSIQVPIVLRNDGAETWDPERAYALSYHWRARDGGVIDWEGLRTALPIPVPPGEQLSMQARVVIPDQPGEYLLQWDVVEEGVRWMTDDDPSPPEPMPVTVRIGHAFSLVGGGAPRWIEANGSATRRIELRNDGSLTWRADGGFGVSYHWFGPGDEVLVWDGIRSAVSSSVAPGETVALELVIRAPQRPGWYRLQLDMVEEGVTWFSRRDPSPEPLRRVLVAGSPRMTPGVWAFVALGLALVTVGVLRRDRPRLAVEAVAWVDIVWCAGSLLVKQAEVLAEAGQAVPLGGRLIAWAGAAVLLLPLLLVPRRLRPWLCWLCAVAATAVLFADLVYQRFFGDILSLAVADAAGQVGQLRASVWSLVRLSDLWWWVDLLPGLAIALLVSRLPREVGRRLLRPLAAVLVVLLVAGAAATLRLVRSGTGVLEQVFRNVFVARDVGVLNFHAYDLGRHLVRRAFQEPLTDQRYDRVVRWFADRAEQRAGTGAWFGVAEGSNLLMIQAESLQGFVIDLEVNGQQITPFLNRWARASLIFPRLTDQTAQGRSSDSELLTQTSLLPPDRGTAAFRYPGNSFTGVAGILTGTGYQSLSAVPFDGGFWNRRSTHPSYGFDDSLFGDDFEPGEAIGWGLNDRDFLSQMVDRMATLDRPFCVWLLTLGLHHPFEGFPAHRRVLALGGWEGTPFGNYLHTMHHFDVAMEELIDGLRAAGLADSTVVALWGDHDAGLEWESPLAGIAGQPHSDAGWYLSQQVPLIVHVPRQDGLVGVRPVVAGHQDVAPTLLALLGVDPAEYAFVGRNLLGEPGDAPVAGEYRCWSDEERLYLRRGPALSDGECFDLDDLELQSVEACADGFAEVEAQLEVSRLVLEHDLQRRLHDELSVPLGGGQ